MTTLVIHGTLAQGASWYWNSWEQGGFCHALVTGMEAVSGSHDVWRVQGESIETNNRFEWSGLAEGLYRGDGADKLVQYLNQLRRRTDEPIRIIAHSHGCNVVKLASMSPGLSANVSKAVFLACPHFWEVNYEAAEPASLSERFSFERLHPRGRKYRYRASPQRFGKILNLYSERDGVQVDLAKSLSGGMVPLTGRFVDDFLKMLRTGDVYELPMADRMDSDPLAQHLYENFAVPTAKGCGETAVHTAMHGATVAKLCGVWLNSETPIESLVSELIAEIGGFPEIEAGDTGA